MTTEKNILLIDGDNVSADFVKTIIEIASQYGETAERHIYANCKLLSDDWNREIYKNIIKVHHCTAVAKKKNSTDIALAIDAVKMTYDKPDIATYIIVTNDKDFMPLAFYLRECGKKSVCLYVNENCKAVIAFDHAHQLKPGGNKPAPTPSPAPARKTAPSAPTTQKSEAATLDYAGVAKKLHTAIAEKTKDDQKYFISDLRTEFKDEAKLLMKFTNLKLIVSAVGKMLKDFEFFGEYKLAFQQVGKSKNYFIKRKQSE